MLAAPQDLPAGQDAEEVGQDGLGADLVRLPPRRPIGRREGAPAVALDALLGVAAAPGDEGAGEAGVALRAARRLLLSARARVRGYFPRSIAASKRFMRSLP